jgi:hypothetical protein
MATFESWISRVTDSVAAWRGVEESVTVSVNVKVPAASGVPDSSPPELSDIPSGSVPVTLQIKGAMPPMGETNVNLS